MDTGQRRPLVARLRRRMLLALGRGAAPLPPATAAALLPELAERFAAGDDLDDAPGLAFLAALNDDPALAETFALVASATAATGAAHPSAALSRRLAALPGATPAQRPTLPAGRAIEVARALAPSRLPAPPPGLTLREVAGGYDAGPAPPAPWLMVEGDAGAAVEVSFAEERGAAGSRRVTVLLRDPTTGEPAGAGWRVTARVGRRRLPGGYVAPGVWAPTRGVTDEEFARLIVAVGLDATPVGET